MTEHDILRIMHARRSGVKLNANANPNVLLRKDIKQITDGKSVLITGGIGDFLAIEPFVFSCDKDIKKVFMATRGITEITELIRKGYPEIEVKNLLPVFPKNFYCFFSLEHTFSYMKEKKIYMPADFSRATDFSISRIFPKIQKDYLKFTKSRYLDKTYADIGKYNLPAEYVSLVTATTRDAGHAGRGRNLNTAEIDLIRKKIGCPLVCVYCECQNPHPEIIHVKKCSMFESLEILKKSKGYIGVDSWLSVIAGWLFPSTAIAVKCINEHGYNNKKCYWPLLPSQNFLYRDLVHDFIFQPKK